MKTTVYRFSSPGTSKLPPSVTVLRVRSRVVLATSSWGIVFQLAKWTQRGRSVDLFSMREAFVEEIEPGVWRIKRIKRSGLAISGDYDPKTGLVHVDQHDHQKLGVAGRLTLRDMIAEAELRRNPTRKARKNSRKRKRAK